MLEAPPPGCRCNEPALSTAGRLRAALAGVEPEACPIHDHGEVERRRDRAERADLEDELQRSEAFRQRVLGQDAAAEAKRAEKARQQRAEGLAKLATTDEMLARVIDAVGAPLPAIAEADDADGLTAAVLAKVSPRPVALNARPDQFEALRGFRNADTPNDAA